MERHWSRLRTRRNIHEHRRRQRPTPELLRLLAAGVLSSDSELRSGADSWSVTGDPTEGALVVAAAKAGLDKAELEAEEPRTQEIPFTSESKRMTTLHRTAGAVAYTKGAPEMLLPRLRPCVDSHRRRSPRCGTPPATGRGWACLRR